MAIRVRGTLSIARKTGKRGDFNIGDLLTEIGEFEVKDSLIEEFEPGKYTGEFIIQWIEPDSFAWRGKVFVKNRATLAEILIDQAEEGATPPAPPPEPDPIEGTSDGKSASFSATPTVASQADSDGVIPEPIKPQAPPTLPMVDKSITANATPVSGDEELFGPELSASVARLAPIKLDPTVDRQHFRSQINRLKTLHYSFDAKAQTWTVVREALDIPF